MPSTISYLLNRKISKKKNTKIWCYSLWKLPEIKINRRSWMDWRFLPFYWIMKSCHVMKERRIPSHYKCGQRVRNKRILIAAEKLHFDWWFLLFYYWLVMQHALHFKLGSSLFKIERDVSAKITRSLDNNLIGLLISQAKREPCVYSTWKPKTKL